MPKLTVEQAKARVILLLSNGSTVGEAMDSVDRTMKSYEGWRRNDPEFKAACDEARHNAGKAKAAGKDADLYSLSFAQWRKRFLNQDTYAHQQMWIDALEGREPDVYHEAITYIPGDERLLCINTPPFHCATLDTPVFTRDGWKTVGTVTTEDFLLGRDGLFWPVYDAWMSDGDVDLYEVEFETGDVITTDGGHIWAVTKTMTGATAEMTTEQLMGDLRWGNKAQTIKWKVEIGQAFDAPEADLPVDPYLLGYWLGDGDKNGSRLTVSVGDLPSLTDHLDMLGLTYSVRGDSRNPETTKVIYIHGIRAELPLGEKRIPDAYFTASYKQRLALLQGLMDTDGTINPRDGRASFIQVKDDLSLDAYRLVSSLGLKAAWKKEKQGKTSPYGKPSSERINRIYFKPNGDPVFKLERKASKQKVTTSHCKTNYRTIRDIRPAGRGQVRCLSVASTGDLYAIGDAMIQTHNAKSATITTQYVAYRLCMNPAFRVMIISKTAEMASKFLFSIRQYLTDPMFAELQAAYAPPGGFKPAKGDGRWGNNLIYLAGRNIDAADKAAKDPSVQAVGIGGQVYGARADLIILDDAVDDSNAHSYEKQFDWLTRTVMSRAKDGKVLLVGTRVAPADLYSHVLNPDTYMTGKSPWTYIAQPAVLEYAEDPADWKTLWPRSSQPLDEAGGEKPDENGLYSAWDGLSLQRVRAANRPGVWALVYMQQQVSDDMTFHPVAVWGSVDRRRKPGPLVAGGWGHPKDGIEGKRVVLSIDPAGTGQAFLLVYAVDRTTRERWVLNAFTASNTKPSWYAEQIKTITPTYGVHEVVIEQNAYASWIIHDETIVAYCRDQGVMITPHYTGANKQDPDFGVATMASLFGNLVEKHEGGEKVHEKGSNVIHLPDPDFSPGVKALIEQLLTWVPGKLGRQLRQDGPMALWFAELRARNYLTGGDRPAVAHARNRFISPRHARRRGIVPAGF